MRMGDYDNLDTYTGNVEHDMWVDFDRYYKNFLTKHCYEGIDRRIEGYTDALKPRFKSTSTQFQTVIYASPTVADDTMDDVDVINDVINRLKVKLTDRQTVILNMIAKSPTITIKRMSEMLSVTQRSVARDISVLKNAGIIIRKGKRNDGTWEIMSHKSHPNHD